MLLLSRLKQNYKKLYAWYENHGKKKSANKKRSKRSRTSQVAGAPSSDSASRQTNEKVPHRKQTEPSGGNCDMVPIAEQNALQNETPTQTPSPSQQVHQRCSNCNLVRDIWESREKFITSLVTLVVSFVDSKSQPWILGQKDIQADK